MQSNRIPRRDWLVGTGASLLALAASAKTGAASVQPQAQKSSAAEDADRARRMQWWHEARFGMFIHWGLYSVLGRHEWVMENEGIPVTEYEQLAKRFQPKPNAARAWARLAKQAGQKYMVMTSKHHEGFCNFDTKLTNYCAPKQGPSLTNYGKVDVLWYDVSWPLDVRGWESERMNKMVFELQPDIIVNNRNALPGDFSTPEQKIVADERGRAWETCMTLNESWGYHQADDAWKTPKTIVRNLVYCAHDAGNYLLNIGPKPDGSIPEESVRILTEVGRWTSRNGESIRTQDRCQPHRSNYAGFTRKGNTLYMHVYFWPGETIALAGLKTGVKSARLLASGQQVKFQQDRFRVRFTGLPAEAPDHPVTTIAIECESEPLQDTDFVRRERPRNNV